MAALLAIISSVIKLLNIITKITEFMHILFSFSMLSQMLLQVFATRNETVARQ